ncbi:phosphatidylglycerophosphatase A family protein [Limosilactobacillus reuteri]|uniref:phosphatidylglycerophosphatase A family protein n=1 Tax=Limosilactobacillus reuteri TaxID=1598 RepID=UPI001E412EA4|nr:phosphatidylglycerophosphatase A [Limosilactobacillus reuteri]MCC4359112.1 phosphatidylglycerophosphatase A [Limosilactobacillus reuteri]MCC4361747.1 phosphatidylglycerophosphatase A [Limosilactobacillus reuteri]MCC4365416.1 phosphatidylglycerophosphatase A [Limosilactobacillus reuteri]
MVATKGFKYPDRELYDWVLNELHKRNINNETIGEIAYDMQHQYLPHLTVEDFGAQLDEVLKKREVLNILATGFALDNLAQDGLLPEPLQSIVKEDAGVYGVDETISLALSQLYGSIAVTNYGYEDKKKLGIAAQLDNSNGQVNTFADDLALALASAVIGRCGHGSKLELDDNTVEEPANDEFKELKFVVNGKEVEPQGDLVYFAKPIKSDRKLPTWNLNKFAHDLNKAINDSRELADRLEEEFNHDYYVNLEVGMNDESTWQLVIELLDNKMELVDVVLIDLEHLLDYLEVDSPSEFVDAAQMIAQFVFEHDLYPYPEDSNDLEESNDEDTSSSIENSIQHIAQELESIVKQATGDQDSSPKDNPLDKLLQIMLLAGDVWGNQENLSSNNRKDDANE